MDETERDGGRAYPGGWPHLSAWMDGDPQASPDAALADWQRDAGAREAWHTYHLIGDVLRSDELARPAVQDEVFLQTLRSRLAVEPVPMAPVSAAAVEAAALRPASPDGRAVAGRWWAPAAVAAGFMAVAGLYVLQSPLDASPSIAGFGSGLSPVSAPVVVLPPPLREPLLPASEAQVTGVMRDPRLDRYLERHRHFSGSPVGPMPGAALRAVDTLGGEER